MISKRRTFTQLVQELAAAKAAEQERLAQQRVQQEQWQAQKIQLQQEFENLANKIFREKASNSLAAVKSIWVCC